MTRIVLFSDEVTAYFLLIWLFVIIISGLVVILCLLYLAIQNSQRRELRSLAFSDMMIAGQEAERRRVSREIHDTVLPEVRDPAVSEQIRAICMELMPPDFVSLSLRDSLAGLCVRFSKRNGIECVHSLEPGLDFSHLLPESQLHIYRMVQESFTNIEKHAAAHRVVLVARRLSATPAGPVILICVSDDGRGFPAEGCPPAEGGHPTEGCHPVEGLGMMTMRQRAAILGCRLDFVSENGHGLMVRMEIPPPPQIEAASG
ncbi:hypothetical protein AGMMS50293_13320 [Spirochaetia bacterium]|nr:hypothetical protein AGMMS50293_13320 [Spirochaetia bacterium]